MLLKRTHIGSQHQIGLVFRHKIERFRKVCLGFGIFFHQFIHEPACVISANQKRTVLQRPVAIQLRTIQVAQLRFGNGSIQIRLCEVGFELDDLIEILNRHHIIFKI